jgi:hypothetical protein
MIRGCAILLSDSDGKFSRVRYSVGHKNEAAGHNSGSL